MSFIRDVAPILKEHCIVCHDAKKRSGKLEMTTFAKLRKGGSGDDPIVEGKPDESLLIDLLTAEGPKRMPPPPRERLSDRDGALAADKVAVIARWIREGARLDAGLTPDSDILRELRKRWQPPLPPLQYVRPVVVSALAFTSDSQRLVVGGHFELTIWNVADGKLLQRLRTRTERTAALQFLPDGMLAVAGGRPGQEGELDVYDLNAPPSGTENGVVRLDGVSNPKVHVAHLLDTDDCLLCLAISADGKSLAAGGCDRLIRVWDIAGGVGAAKLRQSIENHADWVLGMAFSPDGRRLFTASRDKTAKVWDLAKSESVQTFPDHQQAVYGVAVRADGKAGLSVGADKTLRIWNADGAGKPIKAAGGHTGEILKIAPIPGQPLVATASADKTVRIWKDDGSAVKTLFGLNDQVCSIAVSPDAKLIAAGAWDGEVRVWKMTDGSVLRAFNASPGYVKERVASDAK